MAWLDRTHVELIDGGNVWRLPSIRLRDEAQSFMDHVVLSVLVIEHQLRAKEGAQAAKNTAGAGATGSLAGAGGGPMLVK